MGQKFWRIIKVPEVFILVTILAVLALIVVIMLGQSRQSSRDVERRQTLASFLNAVELFKQDYNFYPNYSMTLGLNKNASNKSANYDLAASLPLCADYSGWDATKSAYTADYQDLAVAKDLKTPQKNLDQAFLKPGFQAVSKFLVCLGYLEVSSSDPLWAGTVSDYQYRVSHNYQQIVVLGSLERGKTQLSPLTGDYRGPVDVLGNGTANRALFEDSDYAVVDDPSYFQAFVDKTIRNGRYLYQCVINNNKKSLSIAERASEKYAPFVLNEGGQWLPNPACQDSLKGLLTVNTN